MWDGYSFALDAVDVAHEDVESAREALTLEMKMSSLKIQAMSNSKLNMEISHGLCMTFRGTSTLGCSSISCYSLFLPID